MSSKMKKVKMNSISKGNSALETEIQNNLKGLQYE